MNHRIARIAVILGSIALVSCGRIGDGTEPPSDERSPTAKAEHPDDHHHPMTIDWITVEDLPELVGASHAVVRGRVVEQRFENQVLYPWSEEKDRYLTAEEAGDEVTEIPWTISTVLLDEVVHARNDARSMDGGDLRSSAVIEIAELGGQLACGCFVHPDDKPVLQPSEEAFFFLSHAASIAGRYHVIGGWQGRFQLTHRGVRSLAVDTHPGAREFSRFDDADVDAFVAEVRTLAERASPHP